MKIAPQPSCIFLLIVAATVRCGIPHKSLFLVNGHSLLQYDEEWVNESYLNLSSTFQGPPSVSVPELGCAWPVVTYFIPNTTVLAACGSKVYVSHISIPSTGSPPPDNGPRLAFKIGRSDGFITAIGVAGTRNPKYNSLWIATSNKRIMKLNITSHAQVNGDVWYVCPSDGTIVTAPLGQNVAVPDECLSNNTLHQLIVGSSSLSYTDWLNPPSLPSGLQLISLGMTPGCTPHPPTGSHRCNWKYPFAVSTVPQYISTTKGGLALMTIAICERHHVPGVFPNCMWPPPDDPPLPGCGSLDVGPVIFSTESSPPMNSSTLWVNEDYITFELQNSTLPFTVKSVFWDSTYQAAYVQGLNRTGQQVLYRYNYCTWTMEQIAVPALTITSSFSISNRSMENLPYGGIFVLLYNTFENVFLPV